MRSFSAGRATALSCQPSQPANTAGMPSGSAQAPLRPSRAYVDAEGVFYSDEEEPNPKCKNNKDERGRGLCAQLGRMVGLEKGLYLTHFLVRNLPQTTSKSPGGSQA